ncbi:MAG: MBL fold metallo-hydrolase [Elusimicrobiota bacterium]
MKLIKLIVGCLETNCYIVFDDKTRDAVIIDPGDEAEKILAVIEKTKLNPLKIINTHSHPDHTGANEKTKEKLRIETFYPEKEGETKKIGTLKLKFFFTPGHTQDSICILIENHLFSGDTIFASSIGRTDLGGGNLEQLLNSIKTKILVLPKATQIHPGHGLDTTVDNELKFNPFLQ